MGRPAEGYRIKFKRGWAYLHCTWKKQLYREALGTRDKREAAEAAPRTYAEIISGRRVKVAKRKWKAVDLADCFDLWLESKRSSVHHRTLETIESYARRFIDYFETLDGITEASASSYGLDRLGQTLRTTVLREIAYLRQFLDYCKLHGFIATVPVVAKLPPKARGHRSGKHRAKPVHITREEALMILAKLPVESKTIDGRKWPIRDRFAFAWEMTFRPETMARLSVPENWRPGMHHVELAELDDKARFAREVDLTAKAFAILRRVAPARGPIFGRHNFSKALKAAAIAVLGPERGRQFAPYDFRHGRAKDILDRAPEKLRGVSYVLGHKRVSTTDKYLAPDRKAGAGALGLHTTHKAPKRPRRGRDAKKPG